MAVGIDDIHAGQFVAEPFEDSLDGEPAHLQTEPGVLLEPVARCAGERARIGAARVGKFQGEIQEARVFRGGKPPAGFTARCGQIQEDLFRVAAGILLDNRPERGRPVEEPFAVKAYFSYASFIRPISSRIFSHAASIAASG